MRFDRAYLAQLRLHEIFGINPTEAQRRAADDLLNNEFDALYWRGFDAGLDHAED